MREASVSDPVKSQATTEVPATAVPSHLRFKSRSNSTQSSRDSSVQPTRSRSASMPRTSLTQKSRQTTPPPTVSGTTVPDGHQDPEASIPDNECPHSPASVGTHDPGFDDQPRSSSPVQIDEVQEEWELDDSLSPQERMQISKEGSEYERSRAYNIIRNTRLTAELKSSVAQLFELDER